MEPVLQIRQLTKRYRNGRGVRGIDLDVRRGDIYGLFGPNGSGKTTVLKIVTGLIRADGGSVSLFGRHPGDGYERSMRKVGCVIETADVYDYMSAEGHLRLIARFHPELPPARIGEVLDWVGLTPYRREKVRGFSLGMKQRLALAASLLHAPELVILDEPSNGLDIEGTVELRELILRLSADNGTTFLVSSHAIDEMERLCTRVGFLYDGTLIREGAVPELTAGLGLEQAYLAEMRRAREGKVHV
ncbi:ABC transporter [Paenibacillus flagellatus]|uniref:ABC transporter n=1 Tax=Paenibacillus flagellatus TaxID=2211139 RepID=A0A2V5K3N4_9BACL|nr:ABC transporter [Paenibacillus flagellatus]